MEDVQKVLTGEQTKFTEETGKLQHEIHEKWMEVKRLTRELDGAKKECEGLRKQYVFVLINEFLFMENHLILFRITKYANNERASLEKSLHKPIPQHMNNTSKFSMFKTAYISKILTFRSIVQ